MRKPFLAWKTFFMFVMLAGGSSLFTVASFAEGPQGKPSSFAALVNRVWKISSDPAPPQGSIYVFLSNGTLLETSCVETYRVATWRSTGRDDGAIEVAEDGRAAFTATFSVVDKHNLRMRQILIHGKEVRKLTLTAIDREFVCSDMPL